MKIMMIRTFTKYHHLRADEDDVDIKSFFEILSVGIYSTHRVDSLEGDRNRGISDLSLSLIQSLDSTLIKL